MRFALTQAAAVLNPKAVQAEVSRSDQSSAISSQDEESLVPRSQEEFEKMISA